MRKNLTLITLFLGLSHVEAQVDESLSHTPRYNGNISAIRWKSVDGEEQITTYTYDGLNRLTSSMYGVLHSGSYQKDRGYFSVPIISYDLNGNILNLKRQGSSLTNTKTVIDDLTYTYTGWGNRLRSVRDGVSDSLGFLDGNKSEDDYAYDANGNMVKDRNKGIDTILYNPLNLPIRVEFDARNYITYLYDAVGTKLQEKVYKSDTLYHRRDYVGEFIYEAKGQESPKLAMIHHEEGRIVPKYGLANGTIEGYDYQYFLTDHLGNVRVTFSTTPENYTMKETFETGEENGFIDLHRHVNTNANTTMGGNEVERLRSGQNGAMIFLSMNKGDTVDLSVNANYESAPTGNTFLVSAYNALFTSFDGVYGSGVEGGINSSSTVFDDALSGIDMSGKGNTSSAPRAFLNYIIFDEEMNYVSAGFKQISTSAQGVGVHETISLNDIIADREGYILAYLSNENQEAVNIYWDDFMVYHGKTNVVERSDFYPGGAMFNRYERTASTPQNWKFQSKEWSPDLRVYHYGPRDWDPYTWRTNALDILADEFPDQSPYSLFRNNPVRFTDPTGMAAVDIIDIEKSTGEITITEAAGDDVVRLVDQGNVEDSYTYGENGSFQSENSIIKNDEGTTVMSMDNTEKAEGFYRFAAQSDVEFANIEVESPSGHTFSAVTTAHEETTVSSAPKIVDRFSRMGFKGIRQSHSHPTGESVPSGHYGYEKGNPYSLMPYKIDGKNVYDAGNALQTKSLKGFGNTKFEVYNPINKIISTYDGINRAKINIRK